MRWGGQTIAICRSCKDRLDSGDVLPESTYSWRDLLDKGLWCDVEDVRTGGDCGLLGADEQPPRPVIDSVTEVEQAEPRRARRFIDRFFGRPPG